MNRSSSVAYIDTISNLLLVFFLLFMIQQLRVIEEAKKSPEAKAEIVIQMEWDPKSYDDIDLWLLTPSGKTIGFPRKDAGIATLDRDDRGAFGDTYNDASGATVVIPVNKEVMTIRAIIPGKYVVNAHYYSRIRITADSPDQPEPVELTYRLIDLNPTFNDVAAGKTIIKSIGDQVTMFSFEVTPTGEVVNVRKDDDLPFVPVTPNVVN